jgi:competence protein ComEC
MSDLWSVALAVATFCGALAAVDGHVPPVSLVLSATVLVVAWLLHRVGRPRPEVLCLGAALLAAALAQRSVAGLDAPVATGPVHAEVTLVGDPVPDGRGGVSVDVRLDGRRLRGVARASPASALDDRLAGERVTVIGRVEAPGPAEAWLRHRHIAGRLAIDTVTGWRPGDAATRLANGLRRTLARGAADLPDRQRSLLAGVTLGDDRAQPADMTDAFRAAGLTHLLAVSGQNVAFVLVIVAPLLARLRFGPRLAVTLAVLAMFALVTRAEPSVLRATAMASVAAVAAALGRPTSSVRTLALGVAGMVLVDPLLATSLGFRLSVAGAAGIVVGATRLEGLLPGPRWFATPLSVTLAAQAAVSPLLVAAFGAVPLASLPANLVAAPAAGPLMVWGLTGGLVAGVVGGPVASLIHLPTRVLLAWLEGVAVAAVRWPLGDLRAGHLAALGAAALLLVAARARTRAGARVPARGGWVLRAASGGLVAAVVVTVVAPFGGTAPARLDHPLGVGATLWRAGGAAVVVLDGRARDGVVLTALRREQVERVDVLVLRTAARSVVDVVATLRRRWPSAVVLVPERDEAAPGAGQVAVEGGVSPPTGTVFDIGALRVTVAGNAAGRLDVQVVARGSPARDVPSNRAALRYPGSIAVATSTSRSRMRGATWARARILGGRARPLVARRAAHRRDPAGRRPGRRPRGPGAGRRGGAGPAVRARGRGRGHRGRPVGCGGRPGRRVDAAADGGSRGPLGARPGGGAGRHDRRRLGGRARRRRRRPGASRRPVRPHRGA